MAYPYNQAAAPDTLEFRSRARPFLLLPLMRPLHKNDPRSAPPCQDFGVQFTRQLTGKDFLAIFQVLPFRGELPGQAPGALFVQWFFFVRQDYKNTSLMASTPFAPATTSNPSNQSRRSSAEIRSEIVSTETSNLATRSLIIGDDSGYRLN